MITYPWFDESFGVGKEKSVGFWHSIIRQVYVKQLLTKEIESYGILKLTQSGKEFINKPIFYGKSTVENQYVRIVEEIEYKPNRLVLFINSLHSLHGVTDKYISPHFRKYMNIIGEFKFELFDFKPYLK